MILSSWLSKHCATVVADYGRLLRPGEESFAAWTLEHVVRAFERAAIDDEAAWLAAFRARYLDLSLSESAWRGRRLGG